MSVRIIMGFSLASICGRCSPDQGLTSRWNSGSVEGRVNHIKMVKRQMFGRAGLPLLRKRVLLTAASQPPSAATSSHR
jgi:hypothetical protein